MKAVCRRHGFTLVELLVAIAVVTILAALALPAIRSARVRGMIAKSTSNLRQLASANLAYAVDRGTFVPASNQNNDRRWSARRLADGTFDASQGYLSPYLGADRRIATCPLLLAATSGDRSFEEGSGGYGYNSSYIGGLPGFGPGHYDADGTDVPERPANVTHPAGTIMFATTALARVGGVQEYPFCDPPFWDFGNGPSGYRPTPSLHFRADGRALVAWCDGHVSAETPDDRPAGTNPYGGDAAANGLGWFGPDKDNGYWNARRP